MNVCLERSDEQLCELPSADGPFSGLQDRGEMGLLAGLEVRLCSTVAAGLPLP